MRIDYACYLLKSEIANLPKKLKEILLIKNQTVPVFITAIENSLVICFYCLHCLLDLNVFAKPVFTVLLRRTKIFDEFYLCFSC